MFLEKMDDLFGMLGGSLRSSITDSTMMWIVHYAMDKAHAKVKSNGGVFQRLNEISKFYELAVIQLEGCMRFVQEEADHGGILESCHEKVLADLTEIRDRLLGRLKESEQAILDKDRELLERFENELKLRQALESKERELVSLNDTFKVPPTNSEDVVEWKGVSRTEDRDGEFGELMQQVLNIKQQLEPDSREVDNEKIEQMGFDINILKETMDHAFGKMQDAIFLSELRPQEKKWRWSIEKETVGALIKGFLMDFKDNFEVEMRKQAKQHSTGLTEHMSHLIKEAASLRDELASLIDLDEAQPNHSDVECRQLRPKEMSLSEGDGIDEDEPEKDGSHVAKMIKSHESIIRRKSEESNWLKREILAERGCSSSTREKNSVTLKGRIQHVIVRLDNLIDCNSKLVENFGDHGIDHREEACPMQESDANYRENSGTNDLEDVWEKINTPVSCAVDEELRNETRMLKQEKEDGNLLLMIMEETHATIFRGLLSELRAHTLELKEDVASNQAETQTREDIFYVVCSETIKDFCSALDCASVSFQEEYALREEVSTILFQETYKEWNAGLERYRNEKLVREDISHIVLDEFMRDILKTANYTLSELQEAKVAENCMYGSSLNIKSCEIAEYTVKEEVYKVFFRQVIDEWKMEIDACNIESIIKDEMHRFILIEAMKEAIVCFMKTEALKQDKTSENVPSADRMDASLDGRVDENLIQNLDVQLKCCEEEKDVMPSSELKEHDGGLDLVEMEHEELNEHDIFQESINDDQSTLTPVRSEPEKANKRLAMSEMEFSELGSGLAIRVDGRERVHDPVTPADTLHDEKSCFCQPKDNAGLYRNQSDSIFKPILEFPQLFVNFEILAHQKLGNSILRLEGMKHQLDSLVEVAASIRKREALYREAFIRRCQNLQKAETEVDLLGDQVDALLGLLEKVHMTLHQYSPLLQQHFEVSEVLKLIQKELTGELHGFGKK